MIATKLIQEGLSLNKALRLIGLSKSSYFYQSKKASEEEKLREWKKFCVKVKFGKL